MSYDVLNNDWETHVVCPYCGQEIFVTLKYTISALNCTNCYKPFNAEVAQNVIIHADNNLIQKKERTDTGFIRDPKSSGVKEYNQGKVYNSKAKAKFMIEWDRVIYYADEFPNVKALAKHLNKSVGKISWLLHKGHIPGAKFKHPDRQGYTLVVYALLRGEYAFYRTEFRKPLARSHKIRYEPPGVEAINENN